MTRPDASPGRRSGYYPDCMSRAARRLMRDRADLEFSQRHALHAWISETYREALRHQAAEIIGAGCQGLQQIAD